MNRIRRIAGIAAIVATLANAALLAQDAPPATTPPAAWDFDPSAIASVFNFLHEYVVLESGISTRLDRWESSPSLDQKIKVATLTIKSFKTDFGVVHATEFDATDTITDQLGVGFTFFWHKQPPQIVNLAPSVNVPVVTSMLTEMAFHANVVSDTTGIVHGQFSSGRARLQLGASFKF